MSTSILYTALFLGNGRGLHRLTQRDEIDVADRPNARDISNRIAWKVPLLRQVGSYQGLDQPATSVHRCLTAMPAVGVAGFWRCES